MRISILLLIKLNHQLYYEHTEYLKVRRLRSQWGFMEAIDLKRNYLVLLTKGSLFIAYSNTLLFDKLTFNVGLNLYSYVQTNLPFV